MQSVPMLRCDYLEFLQNLESRSQCDTAQTDTGVDFGYLNALEGETTQAFLSFSFLLRKAVAQL